MKREGIVSKNDAREEHEYEICRPKRAPLVLILESVGNVIVANSGWNDRSSYEKV